MDTLINWAWDIQSAATLGLIWGIMVLGLYITYRVLDFADMTVDGSFTLGGAMSAVYISGGMQPLVAILVATVGGMAAGFVTGILHTKFKIPGLLAGILCQFGLYSINLRIMGKANFGTLDAETVYSQLKDLGVPSKWAGMIVGLAFAIILIILIYCFFGTEIGCALRATGNNPDMVKAQGTNTDTMMILGLVVGNGLVAMSGALVAQYNGYADIQMGIGAIVIGLAAIIMGEVLFFKKNYFQRLAGAVIGSIVYRIIVAIVLHLGLGKVGFIAKLNIRSDDMKLITAIIVVIALVSPQIKTWFQSGKKKGGAGNA